VTLLYVIQFSSVTYSVSNYTTFFRNVNMVAQLNQMNYLWPLTTTRRVVGL